MLVAGVFLSCTLSSDALVQGRIDDNGAGANQVELDVNSGVAPGVLWSKAYGGAGNEWGGSVAAAKDGGFVITGSTDSNAEGGGSRVYLVKTDSGGVKQWEKTYGDIVKNKDNNSYGMINGNDVARSVLQSADGGYMLAGQTMSGDMGGGGDAYLIKTDSMGKKQWSRTYGGESSDAAWTVIQTSDDGGYLFAGQTMSSGQGGNDAYIVKTDAKGNEKWSKVWGGLLRDVARSVHETSDGGYIVIGYTESYGKGSYDIFLLKLDKDGKEQWGEPGGNKERGIKGKSDVEKLAACGGELNPPCGVKIYGTPGMDFVSSGLVSSDGGFVVTGYTFPIANKDNNGGEGWGGDGDKNKDMDAYLYKADKNGETVWFKTYPRVGRDFSGHVQETTDGGFILAGSTTSQAGGGQDGSRKTDSDKDAILIKTDKDGNELWTKTVSGTGRDVVKSVHQTTDGGFVAAGYTTSTDNGKADFYLIRLAPE